MRGLPLNTLWEMPSEVFGVFFPVLYLMLSTQVVCVFRKSLISAVSNLSMFIKDLFQTGKILFTFPFAFISLVSGLWLMYFGSSRCLPQQPSIWKALFGKYLPSSEDPSRRKWGAIGNLRRLNSCSLHAETGQSAFRPSSRLAHTADLSRLWHEVM